MSEDGKTGLPVKRGRGRLKGDGTLYTEERAEEILDRMCNGETVVGICRADREGNLRADKTFPKFSTVDAWADPHDKNYRSDFGPRYARARLAQQRFWINEVIEISNNPEYGFEDTMEFRTGPDGKSKVVGGRRVRKDMLARSQFKVMTRLQAIERMNPELWAPRLQAPATKDNSEAEPPKLIIEGGLPDDDDLPPADAPEPDKE